MERPAWSGAASRLVGEVRGGAGSPSRTDAPPRAREIQQVAIAATVPLGRLAWLWGAGIAVGTTARAVASSV